MAELAVFCNFASIGVEGVAMECPFGGGVEVVSVGLGDDGGGGSGNVLEWFCFGSGAVWMRRGRSCFGLPFLFFGFGVEFSWMDSFTGEAGAFGAFGATASSACGAGAVGERVGGMWRRETVKADGVGGVLWRVGHPQK